MAKYVVGVLGDVSPGGRKIVEVAGRSIGIFNVAGEYFALRNRCPHQGAELCQGTVCGFVTSSSPGEYTVIRQGEFLRCPWHGWEFEIRTGQSWFDPRKVRVKSYEVSIEAIAADSAAPAAGDERDGLRKGPHRAESYPVSIEQRKIVVEVPN
jgi:nitrite reductase/ring-hydroxylating ferredoxin subunit